MPSRNPNSPLAGNLRIFLRFNQSGEFDDHAKSSHWSSNITVTSLAMNFEYLIADVYHPATDIPEGLETRTVPAFTWAVFPCRGALPDSMQDVNVKIFSE